MSSTSVVHSIGCFPNKLSVTDITCQNIHHICGFTVQVSSYRVRVVCLIRNNLGSVHMGTDQASWLPARLGKFKEGLSRDFSLYRHIP